MFLYADYCNFLLFRLILIRTIHKGQMKKPNQFKKPEHFPFKYVMFITSTFDCHVDKLAMGSTSFPKVSG